MLAISRQRSSVDCALGFTLIEVLVALFVLAVGMLGLALLQTTGLRLNSDSYARTQATYAAYDIIDKMRASVKGVATDADAIAALRNYDVDAATAIANYNSCKTNSCNCASNRCTPTQLAIYDLGKWYELQNRLVPGAQDVPAVVPGVERSRVQIATNTATITMRWIEHENQTDPQSGVQKLRTETWTASIFR